MHQNKFMRIGFDAKRAFLNASGLGNYSRNMISYLTKQFPENEYFMFTPKTSDRFDFIKDNAARTILPQTTFHRTCTSYWRTYSLTGELSKYNLDLYHGLSNEVPYNIVHSDVKSVVTIHDLIFLRLPKLYKRIDRNIYEKKFRYACANADKIIAISEQTKRDIIDFLEPMKVKLQLFIRAVILFFIENPTKKSRKKSGKNLNYLNDLFFR